MSIRGGRISGFDRGNQVRLGDAIDDATHAVKHTALSEEAKIKDSQLTVETHTIFLSQGQKYTIRHYLDDIPAAISVSPLEPVGDLIVEQYGDTRCVFLTSNVDARVRVRITR